MAMCVIGVASALTVLSFCVGWCLRARVEQQIRNDYRALFGASRRSMQHGSEYPSTTHSAWPWGDSGPRNESVDA